MTSKPVSANTFKQFVSTRMTLSLCRTFQTFVLLNMQSGRVNLPIDNGKQERHLHVFLTRPSLRTGSQVEFGVMNSARRASRAQGLRAKKNGGEGGGGGGASFLSFSLPDRALRLTPHLGAQVDQGLLADISSCWWKSGIFREKRSFRRVICSL